MATGTSQSRNEKNALTSIEPAVQAYIRAWGKHENYTYYTLNIRKQEARLSTIIFNLAVNEVEQKTYLLNTENVCVVSSVGGLQAVHQSMHVKSLEFSELTAEINAHWLRDLAEKDPHNQMHWDARQPLNQTVFTPQTTLFVRPRTYARLLTIRVGEKTSTILGNFGHQLSSWKKIIMLMAMVKLYYCGYKMNLHPIPSEVLAFMPPGVPSPPSIDSLQDINNVIVRTCCSEPNQRMIEVLNADNLKIRLIVCLVDGSSDQLPSTVFRDSFGQVLFFVAANISIKLLTALTSGRKEIGTVWVSKNTTLKNEHGVIMCNLKPIDPLPGANPSFQCFGLFDPESNTPTVQSYVDKFCLLYITNLSAIPNTAKALALAHQINTFVFYHKLMNDCLFPRVDKYGFTPRRSK